MSDLLLELGKLSAARKVVGMLGLPLPLPQELERETGPWQKQPLYDRPVVVAAGQGAQFGPALSDALASAGARVFSTLAPDKTDSYLKTDESWLRLPRPIPAHAPPEGVRPFALLFDASDFTGPERLRDLYDFFHPLIRPLQPCGRIIVLGRPASSSNSPTEAAASMALEGFIRSVGREIGRKGATASVVYVEPGAERRLSPVLRFLLSRRSAYFTGQPVLVAATAASCDPVFVRPLERKIALVTGAARGIGAATARALAREGAHVICLDLPSERELIDKLALEIEGSVLPCDITQEEGPLSVSRFIQERFEGLDIAVHNAGTTRDRTLGRMKPKEWELPLAVNLAGLIRLNEALLPLFQDRARIIALSSIAGIAGNVGQTNYSASKAGVIGYVKALAPALSNRGITLNAVAPGFIETRLTAAIPLATREVARRLCNLSQGGLPQDVAEIITFLASPGASGITGQVLRVCGGSFVGA